MTEVRCDRCKAIIAAYEHGIRKGMNEVRRENLGRYFENEEGRIFQMVSYCESPTATMKELGTGLELGGAVSSQLLEDYKLLPPGETELARQIDKQFRVGAHGHFPPKE